MCVFVFGALRTFVDICVRTTYGRLLGGARSSNNKWDKLRRELFGLIEKGSRFISLSHSPVTLLLFVCHFDVYRCAALGNDFCLPTPETGSTSTVFGANTTLSHIQSSTRTHTHRHARALTTRTDSKAII